MEYLLCYAFVCVDVLAQYLDYYLTKINPAKYRVIIHHRLYGVHSSVVKMTNFIIIHVFAVPMCVWRWLVSHVHARESVAMGGGQVKVAGTAHVASC